MADITQKTTQHPITKKNIKGIKNMDGVLLTKSLAASIIAVPSYILVQQQQSMIKYIPLNIQSSIPIPFIAFLV